MVGKSCPARRDRMKRFGLWLITLMIFTVPAFGQGVYQTMVEGNSAPRNSHVSDDAIVIDASSDPKTGCAYLTIGEVAADPCKLVEVPVYLTPFREIGGFSFCIEFRNADLTLIQARRGDLIDDIDPSNNRFKWHYFTYRLNPTSDINKYKVCVVGIGKVYSSYPGMCITGAGQPGILTYVS